MFIHSSTGKVVAVVCAFLLVSGCGVQPSKESVNVSTLDNNSNTIWEKLFFEKKEQHQSVSSEPQKCDRQIVASLSPPEPVKVTCEPIIKTKIVYQSVNVSGKQVVGALERVYFDKLNFSLEARIDTGATTSSLGVTDVQKFERDGNDWVSFVVHPKDSKPITIERQLSRVVLVKRHGGEALERPVIKLPVTVGNVSLLAEFTLTDRSKFSYPALIGRNILKDLIIVDVSYDHLTSKK